MPPRIPVTRIAKGLIQLAETEGGKLLQAARERLPAAPKEVPTARPEVVAKDIGDLWSYWRDPDTWIIVPTHQDRRVGFGIYSQAIDKVPTLQQRYSSAGAPDIAFVRDERIALIPTVPRGQEKADPALIKKGLEAVKAEMDKGNIKKAVLPRLGTGQGGLQWDQSKAVIEGVLGGRNVVVVHPNEGVKARQLTKIAEAEAAGVEPRTAPIPEQPLREIRTAAPKPVEIPPLADGELKEQLARLTNEIQAAQTRQQSIKSEAAGGGTETRNTLLNQINVQTQKAIGLRAWAERAMRAGNYTKQDGTPVIVDAGEKTRLQNLVKKQNRILGGLAERKRDAEAAMGDIAISPDLKWEWVSPDKGRPYLSIIDPTGEFNYRKLRADFGRIQWDTGLRGTRGARYTDKTFAPSEVRGYLPQEVTLPAIRVNIPQEYLAQKPEEALKEGGQVAAEIFGRLRALEPNASAERLARESVYFSKVFGDAPLDNYRVAEDALVAGISNQIGKELTGALRFEGLSHLWQAARYPDYIRGVEILRGRRIPMTAIEGQGMRHLEKILSRAGLTFRKLGEEGPFEIRPGRQQEIRSWVKEAYVRPRVETVLRVLEEAAAKSKESGDPYLSGQVLGDALAAVVREQPGVADDMRKTVVDLIWDDKTGTMGLLNQLRTAVADRVAQQVIRQDGRFPVIMNIPFYSPRLGTGEAGTSGLNIAFVNLSGLPNAPVGVKWAPELLAEAVHRELANSKLWHPLSVGQRSVGRDLARTYPNYVTLQSMGPSLEARLYPGLSRTIQTTGLDVVYNNEAALAKLNPLRPKIEEAASKAAVQSLYENPPPETKITKELEDAVSLEARKMVAEIYDAAGQGLSHFYPGGKEGVTEFRNAPRERRYALSILAHQRQTERGGDPIDLLHQIKNIAREYGTIEGEPSRPARRVVGSVEGMKEVRILRPTEYQAQIKTLVGTPVQAAKEAFRPSGFKQRVGEQLEALGPEQKPPAEEFPKRPLAEVFPTPEVRREIGYPTDVGGQLVGDRSILGRERNVAKSAVDKLFSPDLASTANLRGHMAALFNRWDVTAKTEVLKGGKVVPTHKAADILDLARQGSEIPEGYTLTTKESEGLRAGAATYFVQQLRNFITGEIKPGGNIAQMGAERRDWALHRLDQLHDAMSSIRGEISSKEAMGVLDTTTKLIEQETARLRQPILDVLTSRAAPRVREEVSKAIEEAALADNRLLGPVSDSERIDLVAQMAQKIADILKSEGGFFRPFGSQSAGAEKLVQARSTVPTQTWWEGARNIGMGLLRLPEKVARTHATAERVLTRGWELATHKMARSKQWYNEVVEMFDGVVLEDRWAVVDAVEGKIPLTNLKPGLQIVAAQFRNWADRVAEYIELPWVGIGIPERIRNRVGDTITRDFFGRTEKYLIKKYLPNGLVELEGTITVPGRGWTSGQTFQRTSREVNPHYRTDFFPHVFPGGWVASNSKLLNSTDLAERELAMRFFRTRDEAVQWVLNNAEWNTVSLQSLHSTGGDAAVQAWLDANNIRIMARVTFPIDTKILMSAKALGRLAHDLTNELTVAARAELESQGFSQAVVDSMKMGSQEVWHALRQELGLIPKKRFIGTTQPRKLNLRNYAKDPLEAVFTYVHSAVNGVEGNRFRTDVFGRKGLIHDLRAAAEKDPRLGSTYEYMRKWAEDIETSRPTFNETLIDDMFQFVGREHSFKYRRFLSTASSVMSMLKLGNPMSALVNLTQTAINTYPVLGNHTFVGMHLTLKNSFAPYSTFRGQRLDVLAKTMDIELYLPKWAIDAFGLRGHRGKASYWILYLFNEAEKVNRSIAAFGGYAKGLDKGMTHEQAIEMAKRWAIRRTQFDYGPASLPGLFRDPTMRALLQFKPFLVHELNFIGDLVSPSAKIQRYDPYWKELSRFLIVGVSFTGLLGLPLVEKIDHLVFRNTKDPRTGEGFSFIDELKRLKPELGRFGDVPLRGLGSLFGLDLSQRVGLNVDAENAAEMLFNPEMTISKVARAFSPWTGLMNDLREAIMGFYHDRTEMAADRLWKAILPVQLYTLYNTVKIATGQTPKLQTVMGTQLPIPAIPPALETSVVRPGEIRSPAQEGALFVRLDHNDPSYGYKLLLKAIGGRLPEESAAGETYERYGPKGDVVEGFKDEANRMRNQYIQLVRKGRIEEANALARQGAEIYGLSIQDFQREQEQWDRTLLERAGRTVPKQLRQTVFGRLREAQPGLELPSSQRTKKWY